MECVGGITIGHQRRHARYLSSGMGGVQFGAAMTCTGADVSGFDHRADAGVRPNAWVLADVNAAKLTNRATEKR